jgi:meiotically up-regulated gene 157 (Mug157) protein
MQVEQAWLDDMNAKLSERFGEGTVLGSWLGRLMDNTLSTVKELPDGSVFVITGDIPAMWLRDSSCQLRPFLIPAKRDPKIQDLIVRLLARQMACIQIDPYANAFNESANGKCWAKDKTQMKPEIWERKYEIDSLCFPFQLSYLLWKNTGCTKQFTTDWQKSAELVLSVFETEQYHESRSPYRFERENCPYTDTLSRDGRGALVKEGTGLIFSGFRPSDDACRYGYLIPSNMLAAVTLGQMGKIAEEVLGDKTIAKRAKALAASVRQGIERYGTVRDQYTDNSRYYAYEVDGFGQYNVMDDANLPSLLSLPYIGFCDKDDALYQKTRSIILSDQNPFYFKGKYAAGIGSPHTYPGWIWPMALCMQGLTSSDETEREELLRTILRTDGETSWMHESFDTNAPEHFSRPWFSWANAVFCEFILDMAGEKIKL